MKTTLLDKILESLRKRGWKMTTKHHESCANVGPADMAYYIVSQNEDGSVHITDSGSADRDIDCGVHGTVTDALIAMRVIRPKRDDGPALVKNVDYIDRFGDES